MDFSFAKKALDDYTQGEKEMSGVFHAAQHWEINEM
jgi:hypothetical protein